MKDIPYLEPITVEVELPADFKPTVVAPNERAILKAQRKTAFDFACWCVGKSREFDDKAHAGFRRAEALQKRIDAL